MRRRYEFNTDENNSDDINLDTFERNKNSIHGVPVYVGLLVLAFLIGLFGFVNWIDNVLPTPLTVNDEKSYPDAFITERAQHDLKVLTDIGPRILGSHQNEVLAVDFLRREINFIINQKHENQYIETDVQMVSGEYFLGFGDVGRINKYSNVQNVVVKLHSKNESAYSVLVNSHFDSVPTSPGASDDGINVATMLEVLRKMSRSPNRPQHNVIFLFNGAEETPLQASHGFISQHKWANECVVLVNLEACGAGGKIILFQSGPDRPWLMKYYNMVPHPYAQVAGEEIFQSGIIPSDTDFRIFRDFGNMVGFDMAFFKNGYRYHTKYDRFDFIPLGSYQHVGDNTLSLVKNLANAPELQYPNQEISKVVFFDVFGLFMVSYSTTIAIVINILVVIASIAIFVISIIDFKLGLTKLTLKFMAFSIGAILAGWIISFAFGLFIGLILDKLNYTMSWYSSPWIIFGLYVAPTIALSSAPLFFIRHENLSLNVRCQLQAHLVRLIWTLILFLGTVLGVRSMYAILVPILFNLLGFAVIHLLRIQHSNFRCRFILVRKWQIIYGLSLIIPTMMLMYQTSITLSLFIPVTGRFGSNKNPEFIIGILSIFFTIVITSPYIAVTTLLRDAKYYFGTLAVLFVVTLIVVFTALGLPYNGDVNLATPQRFWIILSRCSFTLKSPSQKFQHTSRTFHNENGKVDRTDAGIFFLNMDRNSPNSVRNYLKDFNRIKSLDEDCEKYVICGLPLSHVRMMEIMKYSTWIPANQPIIHEKVAFSSSKEVLNSTVVKYNIKVTGPDRLGIYIVPKDNMTLEEIQIDTPNNFEYESKKKIYFIHHTYGQTPADVRFSFYIKTPENWNHSTVDLAITSQNVHERLFVKTPYYESFLKQFPNWADVTAWLGSYSSYIL